MHNLDKKKAISARRKIKVSSAKNRREMKRVISVDEPKFEPAKCDLSKINKKIKERMQAEPIVVNRLSAKEIKDQAIKKAIASTTRVKDTDLKSKEIRPGFGWKRFILISACATLIVAAFVFMSHITSSDVSLKVAAMQSGIDASYPSYVPRDFNISDITSENGKITLNFVNNSSKASFVLTEETSSWDSAALLSNYVQDFYGKDYTTVKDQGLTIYIGTNKNGAAWVTGGIVYKINVTSGVLSKKQLVSIAESL